MATPSERALNPLHTYVILYVVRKTKKSLLMEMWKPVFLCCVFFRESRRDDGEVRREKANCMVVAVLLELVQKFIPGLCFLDGVALAGIFHLPKEKNMAWSYQFGGCGPVVERIQGRGGRRRI